MVAGFTREVPEIGFSWADDGADQRPVECVETWLDSLHSKSFVPRS
jgi:hypothetical protein